MSARFKSSSFAPTVLRRAVLAFTLLHCATVSLTAHAEAEAVEPAPSGAELYREAASLMQDKRYEEARQALLELWSKAPTYAVATALAEAELRLKRYAEAMRHLTYAISNPPQVETEKKLEWVETWFSRAKKNVASYVITTNVDGGLVTVDGIPVAETPLRTPIYLEPGRHVIAVSKAGFELAHTPVLASAGVTEELPLSLVLDTAALAQPAAAEGQSSAFLASDRIEGDTLVAPSGSNPWILVAGSVVAAGGLVAGLAFNARSNNARDRVEELRSVTGSSGCYQPVSSFGKTCAELLDAGERRDSARNISSAAFAVGGIAAVGTVLYWFWPRKQDVQQGLNVQVSGAADAHRVGLVVSGSY